MCNDHGHKKIFNTFTTRDGLLARNDPRESTMARVERTGNALINEILQQYRDCSNDSISGPNSLMNSSDHKKGYRTDSDAKQMDVASRESPRRITYALKMPPKAQNGLKFKETLIDGVSLVCFSFGGEKRLCFNELLSKVLKDFSSQDINVLRERLQIFCPRCTPQQMELFKIAGVLPWPCSIASLISKTDAFRLLGSLTSTRAPRRTSRVFSTDSLDVYHECFGGCVGTLEIELYNDPYTNCITCSQCDGIFSPRTFVTHNHSSGESHTCHWGFDGSKWRLYLMLCNEHPTLKMKKIWEMLTNKISSSASHKRKGKAETASSGAPVKMQRSDNADLNHEMPNGKDKTMERSSGSGIMSRRSAFRPWSPLQTRVKSEVMERPEQQSTPRHPAIPIPARLFAPHTMPYISSDSPYPTPRSVHYHAAQFRREIRSPEALQGDETATRSKMGEITSTPSTKDPHSLEKTAREMLAVARNEKWEVMSNQSSNEQLEQSSPRNVVQFLEGSIYQTLVNCMDSGQLPSARSLSSLLAQDLSDVLVKQDNAISEITEAKDKLKAELDSLKENHARKMEEAYDELKNTQKNLRLLEIRHREEGQELNNVIMKLKQDTKAYNIEKAREKNELLSRNEKESAIALKQELREMSVKLEDKESYCNELQNELRALHAWIDSQTRPLMTHGDGRSNNSESVIRTLYVVNGNATSKHQRSLSKDNGLGRNSAESSGEES